MKFLPFNIVLIIIEAWYVIDSPNKNIFII